MNNNQDLLDCTCYSDAIEIELKSPVKLGEGGSSNYNDLTNKPRINDVELIGNKTTEELGINIPTKTSELENDSGFVDSTYVDEHGGKIDTIKVNDVEQEIVDKTVNINVPTKTSELINDSDFTTNAKLEEEITRATNVENNLRDELITKVDKITVPTGKIEAYAQSETGTEGIEISYTAIGYSMARRTNNGQIISTNPSSDSHVATKGYTDKLIETKQDKLTAGNNITIEDNVISATGDVTQEYVDEQVATVNENINKKLDKVTGATSTRQVYGKSTNGTQEMINVDVNASANSLVIRSNGGNIIANDPTSNDQVATKRYVDKLNNTKQDTLTAGDNVTIDNNIVSVNLTNYNTKDETTTELNKKLDKVTSSGKTRLYGIGVDGTQFTITFSNDALTGSIAQRNSGGTLSVAEPTADAHATTKKYVDDIQTTINDNIDDINTKVTTIEGLIPTQASSTNQLADKDFVNSSINAIAATFRGNFATKAALDTWQTENPGVAKQNDYCIVQQDETHSNQQWRYLFQDGAWVAQYKVNDAPFTEAQNAAINSGITSSKVTTYDGYSTSKQNALSTSQLNACNSGITSAKVSTYDGYSTSKQNTLNSTQLNAVNSGVTSAKVTTYDGYGTKITTLETNVANKQNKLTAGYGIGITDDGTISVTIPDGTSKGY